MRGSRATGAAYVALGDSYTIGTAIAPDGRWPERLAAALPGLELVANLGSTATHPPI